MNSLGVALIVLGLALLCCGLVFLVLDKRAQPSPDQSMEEGSEEIDRDLQEPVKERGEV
jgi:hypothetical protein